MRQTKRGQAAVPHPRVRREVGVGDGKAGYRGAHGRNYRIHLARENKSGFRSFGIVKPRLGCGEELGRTGSLREWFNFLGLP